MPLSSSWMQLDNWFTARCWAGTVGIMGLPWPSMYSTIFTWAALHMDLSR